MSANGKQELPYLLIDLSALKSQFFFFCILLVKFEEEVCSYRVHHNGGIARNIRNMFFSAQEYVLHYVNMQIFILSVGTIGNMFSRTLGLSPPFLLHFSHGCHCSPFPFPHHIFRVSFLSPRLLGSSPISPSFSFSLLPSL